MFCYNCGNQVPDGSSYCPNCGRTIENPVQQTYQQPTAEQPTAAQQTYQQPTQPIYQQPTYNQPVYGQPMYGQPVQPKKSSAGKIVLIVVLCVIIIPILLVGMVFGCAACVVCQAEDTFSEYTDYGSSLEDFEYDFNMDGYDFGDFNLDEYDFGDFNLDDYDFGEYDYAYSDELDPAMLEGGWLDIFYGDESFKAVDNGDGTFTLEGDLFFDELMEDLAVDKVVSVTISNCEPAVAPLYIGTLTIDFEDYDYETKVLFSEYMLEFYVRYGDGEDDVVPFYYFKDREAENPSLAEDIIGEWVYYDWSYQFDESGAGERSTDESEYYTNWVVINDFVTVAYGDDAYVDFYYVSIDGDQMTVYWSYYEDLDEFTDVEWCEVTFDRAVNKAV